MSRTTARRLTLAVVISLFVYALACYSPISWSPDGKCVAFVQYAQSEDEKGVAELWVVDVATSQGERIARGEAGLSAPAWSPDGGRIAYLCTDAEGVPEKPKKGVGLKAALALFDLKTKEAKKLCDTFVASEEDRGALIISVSQLQPNWSPDGKLIALDNMEDPAKPKVLVADLSGKTRVLIENASHPVWSPDGRWVACIAKVPALVGSAAKVMLIRDDGSEKHALDVVLPEEDGKPAAWTGIAWAPDSALVAYTSLLKEGTKEHAIFLATRDGKKSILAKGNEDCQLSSPAWTRDGKSLAYIRWEKDAENQPERFAIVAYDMTSGKEKVLTRIEGEEQNQVACPSWDPTGKWLAYRWHSRIVRLVRSDGEEQKALTADPTSLLALVEVLQGIAGNAGQEERFGEARTQAKSAIAYADEFLRRFPDHKACGLVTLNKAGCLRLRNRPQEAADILDSIPLKKANPDVEHQAQMGMAECHVALGQYKDALDIWRGLADLYGGDPVGAEAKKRSDEVAQALDKAQKLTERVEKSKSPADYLALADLYYRTLLDEAKANAALSALLKEAPASREAKEAATLQKKVQEKFAKE